MRPDTGVLQDVAPGIQVLLAPNPGPMTYWGTNTYFVGGGSVAVVDPGPDDPRHLDNLVRALAGRAVSHVLVTHAHADHSPLAKRLGAITGAPVCAFGRHDAGRNPVMQRLAANGDIGGGEGVDAAFMPDVQISEGDVIESDTWRMTVRHTPGHFAGHLSFEFDDILFSGDHAMDWSSSLVSPPDGDLTEYMRTTERLISLAPKRLLTGHGAPIDDPADRLNWLIEHRRAREAQILDAIGVAPRGLEDIVKRVYKDIPQDALPAASRNALAHLIDLCGRGICRADPEIGQAAVFCRGPLF